MTHEDRLQAAHITPAELADWVAASRAEQGLPPTVEDPAAVDRMAALVAPARVESTARPVGRG